MTTTLPLTTDILAGLDNSDSAHFADSDEQHFSHVNADTMAVDSRLFVKIDGTPAVEAKFLAESHLFVIDVMAFIPKVTVLSVDDGHIKVVREGCGFRVGLAAFHEGGMLIADIEDIAAKAKFEGVQLWTKVNTIGLLGLPIDKLALFNLTPENFGLEFLAHIDEAVEALCDFIGDADHRAKMKPHPIQLSVDGGATPNLDNMIWTHRMAVEGIHNGRTFAEQLQRCHDEPSWRAHLLPAVMSNVYDCFGVDGTPTDEQKDEVGQILLKGRGWGR